VLHRRSSPALYLPESGTRNATDSLNQKMTERMKAFLLAPFVPGLMVLGALVAGTVVRERWPRGGT
jgi:hypothetical protein